MSHPNVYQLPLPEPAVGDESCSLCGDGLDGKCFGSTSHPDQPLCEQCSLDCLEGLHEHHLVEDF